MGRGLGRLDLAQSRWVCLKARCREDAQPCRKGSAWESLISTWHPIATLPERPILQRHNSNPSRIGGPALLGKPI